MAEIKDIRQARPICCTMCEHEDWKVYVDWEEALMVQIVKIRCANCMNEIRIKQER